MINSKTFEFLDYAYSEQKKASRDKKDKLQFQVCFVFFSYYYERWWGGILFYFYPCSCKGTQFFKSSARERRYLLTVW